MTTPPRLPRATQQAMRQAQRDAEALRRALGLTAEIVPYLRAMLAKPGEGMEMIPKSVFLPNAEPLVKSGALDPMMVGRQPSGYFDTRRMRAIARAYRATVAAGQQGGHDAD